MTECHGPEDMGHLKRTGKLASRKDIIQSVPKLKEKALIFYFFPKYHIH